MQILIEKGPKAMNKIYISDRGKQHKRINDFLKRSRLPHERRHLEYGDYQIEGKPIVIFVFESIQEFAAAVRDKKKDHFWKQVSRATKGNDMFLFCLIESGEVHNDIELQEWRDCEKNINGALLLSEIETMRKYPRTRVWFFDKRDIAGAVVNILYNDIEKLKAYENL